VATYKLSIAFLSWADLAAASVDSREARQAAVAHMNGWRERLIVYTWSAWASGRRLQRSQLAEALLQRHARR
jgi:hypothetical protein